MASWTTEHDVLLSCLLDDVTGTEEIVQLRKDSSSIKDCLMIRTDGRAVIIQMYFTGSESEGLKLAGSDQDFMMDINDMLNIHVFESLQHNNHSSNLN